MGKHEYWEAARRHKRWAGIRRQLAMAIMIILLALAVMAIASSCYGAVPDLPKKEDGCEYIPGYISIWDVKLVDDDGNEYRDVTTDADREKGNRRMALEMPDGRTDGIIIRGEDRAVIHYWIASWTIH